ncbi:Spindle_Spc25 domain-containing protein, partial [Cephalotus follicularis]
LIFQVNPFKHSGKKKWRAEIEAFISKPKPHPLPPLLSKMQSNTVESVRSKMGSLRLICDREIQMQLHHMDASTVSFNQLLQSLQAKAQETLLNQSKLVKVKAELREAEDEFVKVLAVKTRREANQMATRDFISATKARIEDLKRTLHVKRTRRDEYAAFVSQQSHALAVSEEKRKEDIERKAYIEDAILWYNRVFGLQIEGGHGVKFTFNNINSRNPNEEYSITIRHANDTYTLLDCDPPLNHTEELIHELNRTNGLFKFVRIMREKFHEAAAFGLLPQFTALHPDYSTVSVSAPGSVSTDRSESPVKKNKVEIHHGEVNRPFTNVPGSESPPEHQIQYGEVNRHSKKGSYGREAKPSSLSPWSGSASSLRRSSRLKVKK